MAVATAVETAASWVGVPVRPPVVTEWSGLLLTVFMVAVSISLLVAGVVASVSVAVQVLSSWLPFPVRLGLVFGVVGDFIISRLPRPCANGWGGNAVLALALTKSQLLNPSCTCVVAGWLSALAVPLALCSLSCGVLAIFGFHSAASVMQALGWPVTLDAQAVAAATLFSSSSFSLVSALSFLFCLQKEIGASLLTLSSLCLLPPLSRSPLSPPPPPRLPRPPTHPASPCFMLLYAQSESAPNLTISFRCCASAIFIPPLCACLLSKRVTPNLRINNQRPAASAHPLMSLFACSNAANARP